MNPLALLLLSSLGQAKPVSYVPPIEFVAGQGPRDYFGGVWVLSSLPVAQQENVRAGIAHAASLYPERLLRRKLFFVIVGADLTVGKVSVGGINSPILGAMALAVGKGPNPDYDRIERGFHHELAHLLCDAERFPKAQWQALNPQGFRYRSTSGLDVLRHDDSPMSDDEARRAGFARAYGRASYAEDVATIADTVMSNDRVLRSRPDESPVLRMKCELLLRFYRDLDPAFHPPRDWGKPLDES